MGNARNIAFWVVLLVLVMALFQLFSGNQTTMSSRSLSYSDFIERVDAGQVSKVVLDGEKIVVVGKDGRVRGATIVGRHAGELILPWVVAMQKRLKIGDLTSIIAPYPTLSEATKRTAGTWYTPSLFSERTRRIVRALQWLP